MVASGDQGLTDWPQGHPHAPCPSPAVSAPAAVRAPPSPARLPLGTSAPGPSLHDQSSLQGNPCGGPDTGAPLPVPARGAGWTSGPRQGPQDQGQEPVRTDLCAPFSAALAAQVWFCSPLSPLGFINSREPETREMPLALCLVGAGWALSVGRPCPPPARSLSSLGWHGRQEGQLWA